MTWQEFWDGLIELERPLVTAYRNIVRSIVGESVSFDVLEVGSGWGIFARTLLETSKSAFLTSIDKIPVIGRPDFNIRTEGYEDRIERLIGASKDVLPRLVKGERKFDLIFVDGAHDYDNCLNDLKLCWPMLKEGGVMMIDDVFNNRNWDLAPIGEEEVLKMRNVGNDIYEYGVARALWDFTGAMLPEGKMIEFHRVGSGGLAVIKNDL